MLDLIEEGEFRPPAHRIAERAGVSLRSVFVHFADLDSLYIEAGVRHLERISHLFEDLPETGPLTERIDAFVNQRVRWHEAVRNVRRAAELQEPFSPEMARMLMAPRAAARNEIERVFAIELRGVPEAEQAELLGALDAAASFGTWIELRVHQQLPAPAAARALRRTLAGLLGADRG
jgi:TetR/AcrR family transcriptional regulator of autoinduction and epiphytic fitness